MMFVKLPTKWYNCHAQTNCDFFYNEAEPKRIGRKIIVDALPEVSQRLKQPIFR